MCTSVYQSLPVCITWLYSPPPLLLYTLSQYMADDVIGAIVRQAKKGGAGGSGAKYNETEAQHPFDD